MAVLFGIEGPAPLGFRRRDLLIGDGVFGYFEEESPRQEVRCHFGSLGIEGDEYGSLFEGLPYRERGTQWIALRVGDHVVEVCRQDFLHGGRRALAILIEESKIGAPPPDLAVGQPIAD